MRTVPSIASTEPAPAAKRRSPCSLTALPRSNSVRAGFGQRIAAPPAPEQRDAERLLELGDMAAERRLACRKLSRGGRQAAGFRHGDEALDQVPVDFRHSKMNIRSPNPVNFHSFPGAACSGPKRKARRRKSTKIAILGANGRLGRVVAKAFIDAGYDVRAITRNGKVPAELRAPPPSPAMRSTARR